MRSDNSINKINLHYFIALIPLIIYGLYKNGLFIYLNYDNNILYIFKPIIIIFGSLLLSYIYNKTFIKKPFVPYIALLTSLCVPIGINIFIYFIILSIGLILIKYLKTINMVVVVKLLVVLSLIILGDYTYFNDFEINNSVEYNVSNMIFGNAFGGIGNTLLVYIPIAYIYLTSISIYKWKIPLIILISYLITSLCFIPFMSINELLFNFINSSLLFVSVFIATIPIYSPVKIRNTFIYSLSIGIVSSILINLVSIYEGAYLALLIVSIGFYIYLKVKNKS